MSNLDPKVLEKIKKLMDLHEGALQIDSLAEAEAAASKMQYLLLKHNLEMADIHAHASKNGGFKLDLKSNVINLAKPEGFFIKKNEGSWVLLLYHRVAKYNMAEVIGGGKYSLYIISTAETAELIDYFVRGIIPRIRAIEVQKWSEYERNGGWEKRGKFRRGFFIGAVNGIAHQLQENQSIAKEEPKAGALIRASEVALQDAISKFFPKLGKKRTSSSSAHGRAMGFEAGKSLGLHKGIDGSAPNSRGHLN